MAKFLSKAIKHPGREKARAKASGRSLGEQLEVDSHSKNPSIRGAGLLGKRLRSREFRHKR